METPIGIRRPGRDRRISCERGAVRAQLLDTAHALHEVRQLLSGGSCRSDFFEIGLTHD